jgi:hypothetical protein
MPETFINKKFANHAERNGCGLIAALRSHFAGGTQMETKTNLRLFDVSAEWSIFLCLLRSTEL